MADIIDQSEVFLLKGHANAVMGSETVTKMIKVIEKRIDKRHDCDATIKWTHFNRIASDDRPMFNLGRAVNFSESGLYFKTDYPLKPGITILFRIETSRARTSTSEDYPYLRTISLAEVKWCRDLATTDEFCFGIGAHYPPPP